MWYRNTELLTPVYSAVYCRCMKNIITIKIRTTIYLLVVLLVISGISHALAPATVSAQNFYDLPQYNYNNNNHYPGSECWFVGYNTSVRDGLMDQLLAAIGGRWISGIVGVGEKYGRHLAIYNHLFGDWRNLTEIHAALYTMDDVLGKLMVGNPGTFREINGEWESANAEFKDAFSSYMSGVRSRHNAWAAVVHEELEKMDVESMDKTQHYLNPLNRNCFSENLVYKLRYSVMGNVFGVPLFHFNKSGNGGHIAGTRPLFWHWSKMDEVQKRYDFLIWMRFGDPDALRAELAAEQEEGSEEDETETPTQPVVNADGSRCTTNEDGSRVCVPAGRTGTRAVVNDPAPTPAPAPEPGSETQLSDTHIADEPVNQ